ncbi:MAG: hypothetical protein FIB06_09450 [Betaproteobacteria bacterium]|nr:hypothetical protein [Betaproteobacteria bacterium]
MTEHRHIVEAFENYLESDRPGHALMVAGEWGSGKTHFWKTVLDPLLERKQRAKVLVSLYGVKSHEDIERQVVSAIYPMLKTGLFKTLKAALEKWVGFGLSLFRLEPRLHRAVFCFDDLERATIPQWEALGYINRFIEQYGSHVVILANEVKISDTRYAEMKEKVVGKTFQFEPDLDEALNSIVGEMRECKHKLLDARFTSVKAAILKSKPVNLRSAIQAVDNCNLVLKRLDGKSALPPEVLDAVTSMVAACTMQERIGKDTLGHLSALFADTHAFYFSRYVRQREGAEDGPLAAVEEFAGRFFDGNADLIPPLTAVVSFIETGRLDTDSLHAQAALLAKKESKEPDDMYRQFLRDPFMLNSDAELLRLADESTHRVAAGEITNATELSLLFSVLDFLSRHAMLQTSSADLAALFCSSIEKLSADGRFRDGDFEGYMSLSRFGMPVSEELRAVIGVLDIAKEKVHEVAHARRIENLRIEMDLHFESFVKRMTGGIDGETFDYAHEPVLSQMGSGPVARILGGKTAREIRLFESMLRQRYLRVTNIGDFLSVEYEFLLDLNQKISDLFKANKGSLQGVAFEMLSDVLTNAAKRIAPASHAEETSAG